MSVLLSNNMGLRPGPYSDSIEAEYLRYAKQGALKTWELARPAMVVYVLADYLYVPFLWREFFLLRIVGMFLGYAATQFVLRAKNLRQYSIRYFIGIQVYSFIVNYFIWRSNLPPNLYYAGLLIVAMAGIGFYTTSRLYTIVLLLGIYLPSLIGSLRFMDVPGFWSDYYNFTVLVLSSSIFLLLFRDNQAQLMSTEILARLSLQSDLEKTHSEVGQKDTELFQVKQELQTQAKQSSAQKAMVTAVRQAAHDIRSPLSALSVVTKSLQSLSPDHRALAQAAIDRITKTAEELLLSAKSPGSLRVEKVLLRPLIEQIINEKKAVFGGEGFVEFHLLDIEGKGAMARVDRDQFLRVIANLIQNSIEAIEKKGVVRIEIRATPDEVAVEISDNGKGISDQVLAQIGREGASFGKKAGHGLGLYHAKTQVEQWGGRFDVQSVVGQWTSVRMYLK